MVDKTSGEPAIIEVDAEKLWAEFEAADAGKEAAQATAKPADPAASFTEAENAATTEQTEAAAGQPPAQAQTPKAPGNGAAASELDWSKVPPEYRAAHEAEAERVRKAEEASRRDAGRVRSYQERYERLRTSAASTGAAQGEPKIAEVIQQDLSEYPEIAGPLTKVAAHIEDRVGKLAEAEQQRQNRERAEVGDYIQSQEAILDAAHSDWEQVIKDNSQAFGAWIDDQPRRFRDIVHGNRDNITDGAGGAEVMTAFKAFLGTQEQPPQPAPRASATQQQELNPRRASQLSGTASPRGAARIPVATGIPANGDEQQIWNAFAASDPDERQYRRA